MTEAEIKAFLAICRCGNMTKAAENLYISQPSLSSRLKTLEREVGHALFYRHKGGRETVLTLKGEEFYRLAVEYENVLDRMQRMCAAEPMKLRVSSLHSVGTYILPPVYDAFMQKYVFKPFVLGKNVVGVELNFNKEFYVPEKIDKVKDVLEEIRSLNNELMGIDL